MEPGKITREGVAYGTGGLTIRTKDLETRVRLDVSPSNEPSRPNALSFYNLAVADRGGNKPVELFVGTIYSSS